MHILIETLLYQMFWSTVYIKIVVKDNWKYIAWYLEIILSDKYLLHNMIKNIITEYNLVQVWVMQDPNYFQSFEKMYSSILIHYK